MSSDLMTPEHRAQIISAFNAEWDAHMMTEAKPDGPKIMHAISMRMGLPFNEVREILIQDHMANL